MNKNDFRGLSRAVVERISAEKNEPAWMTDFRLRALEVFLEKPLPLWGADLSGLTFDDIYYYLRPVEHQSSSWSDVPENIKKTFDALGIPQAEQKYLAGVGAQFESEVIYKRLKKEWQDCGVIFCDTSTALREHEEIFKKYFSTIIPPNDNAFAALNSAVWSGGSFVWIPAGVQVTLPLQAYFRINQTQMGQFERTLIIAEAGSSVHYVEGCSAPLSSRASLHAAVVEIVAHEKSRVQYTTIQNWSTNVYNLVTKRASAYKNATVSWVDGNFGSGVTMKYPAVILQEEGAHGSVLSIAVAKKGQHQDSGAKMIHLAPRTTSTVVAKSISSGGGRSTYRGLVKMTPRAMHSRARVQCDALILDAQSRSDTYPTMMNAAPRSCIEHEASVSRVSEAQQAYCASRGLSAQMTTAMLVNGFIEPFVAQLPMEYAVEINRLIAHEMEGSVG